ncbi:sugar ABC transporter permease [Paenibacillus sp. 598K]|uniref:carbohydrate ABC transporter permease n=1 Tax=Paenibacillus sp. 598K TaxID=1117987 RepID=UPI000FF9D00F|nr:carbohydrate ABC transporter permease [Paenibacillus sp. 598K]GBF71828.1 sugar ABC transporter permease [Paenibacillus sp. 598K]
MMRTSKASPLIGILLLLLLVVYLFPVYLIALNSFKPFREIFDSFLALPHALYVDNYVRAWSSTNFAKAFVNNIIITATSVAGVILVAALAGYKLSRDRSRLSWLIYLLCTFPFMIPFYTYMIPLVQLSKTLHITNNPLALSLIYMSTGSFAVFLIHAFVKSIPRELDESAYMDGCSELGFFFRIIFPLLKPAISSVAILYALWTWNDFLLPFLLLTDKEAATLTINIYKLFGKFGSDWDIITASLILSSLPIVILYIALQKYIISGVAAGAVKG